MPQQIRGRIRSVAWNKAETAVATSDDTDVDVQDTASGALVFQIRKARHRVQALAFSPNGESLYALGDSEDGLALWRHSLVGGQATCLVSGLHGAAQQLLACSPDQVAFHITTFLIGHEQRTTVLWRDQSRLLSWHAEGKDEALLPVRRLAIESDSTLLAFLDDVVERWTWDAPSGVPTRSVVCRLPSGRHRQLFSAPLGGRVAFAERYGETGVHGLLDLRSGEVHAFEAPPFDDVALSPDGTWTGLRGSGGGASWREAPCACFVWRPGQLPRPVISASAADWKLSPSGARVLLVRGEGRLEIQAADAAPLDLSEDARLPSVGVTDTGPTLEQVEERRVELDRLLESGFSADAVKVYRDWLARSRVPLWQALVSPESEDQKARLVAFFKAARGLTMDPRVEEGLLALRPWHEHVEGMGGLQGWISDDPTLAEVQCLDITADPLGYGGSKFSAPIAEALANNPRALGLVELTFSGSGLTGRGARALARSPNLRRLRSLELSWESLSLVAVKAVAKAFPRLQALTLNFCFEGRALEGARALGRATFASRLVWLDLSGNGVDDDALAALLDSPLATSLRGLRIGWSQGPNRITANGLRRLSDSPLARRLVHLDLDNNALRPAGLDVLAGAPFDALRSLSLGLTAIGGGVEALTGVEWPALRSLCLHHNRLGAADIATLTKAALLRQLTSLTLTANPMGDDGARSLGQAGLSNLQALHIGDRCEIGDAGWQALRASALSGPAKEALRDGVSVVPVGLVQVHRAVSL